MKVIKGEDKVAFIGVSTPVLLDSSVDCYKVVNRF